MLSNSTCRSWSTAAHFATDEALPWFHPVGAAVLNRLPELPLGAVVLDVACGSGEPGLTLARRLPGLRLLGVDSSPCMIELARRRADRDGLAVAQFRVMSVNALDVHSGSVDALISRFGLLEVGDPAVSTREAARALRPGGPFSVAVWDGVAFGSLTTAVEYALAKSGAAERLPRASEPDAHARGADTLRAAGMRTLKSEPLEWSVDVTSCDAVWDFVSVHEDFAPAFSGVPAGDHGNIRRRLAAALEQYRVQGGNYRMPMSCRIFWGNRD